MIGRERELWRQQTLLRRFPDATALLMPRAHPIFGLIMTALLLTACADRGADDPPLRRSGSSGLYLGGAGGVNFQNR